MTADVVHATTAGVAAPVAGEAATSDATRSRSFSRPRAGLPWEVAGLAGVVLLGAVLIALHVRADPRLSPIDELQHVDYVVKAGQLHLPRLGETDGAVARHEIACRGVEAAFSPPPCASSDKAPNGAYPENAIDTAASDPPLYYVITGLAARAANGVIHTRSIVTLARLFGIVWLAAGVVLLWLAMRVLGIGLVVRMAVSALVVTTPVVLHSNATVTSDAVLLLGGAAAFFTVLLWEQRRLPGWVVFLVAGLCGLTKIPCVLAVVAAGLYLAIRAARRRTLGEHPTRSRREMVGMALASSAVAVGVVLLWLVIVHVRSIPGSPLSPSAASFRVDHFPVSRLLSQYSALVSPVSDPPVLAPLQGKITLAIVAAFNVLLLVAAFGGAALSRAGSRLEAIATSAAALMLVGGPAFVVAIYLSEHQVLPSIPHRYGLALVPMVAAALAMILIKAWVRWTVIGLAAFASLYTLVHVATV